MWRPSRGLPASWGREGHHQEKAGPFDPQGPWQAALTPTTHPRLQTAWKLRLSAGLTGAPGILRGPTLGIQWQKQAVGQEVGRRKTGW